MQFFLGGGWGDWGSDKILKLVRITPETWNLVRKYTYIVSKSKPFSTKALLILLMSAFFVCKISVFLGENGILVFLGENTTRKLAINWKNNNNSQFADMTWSWFFFFFLTLPSFSHWIYLLVQVSWQYHDWFWSYDNFRLKRIDQKSGNWEVWVFSQSEFLPTSWDWGELGIP